MSEKSGYEIAIERIEEVAKTGATKLDLSGLGLVEVPDELFYDIQNLRGPEKAEQPITLVKPSHPLRVLLWHSPEDVQKAQELYNQLSTEGWMDVWFDQTSILPGQDWDKEIEKAIQKADVVILCMSEHSKWGQPKPPKEILAIYDIFKLMPDGSIYVIPLRLDNCQPINWLRKIQYADYYPEDKQKSAYHRILESLKFRARKLSILPPVADSLSRSLSIFLNYVKEDRDVVQTLSNQLAKEGWIDVWTDEEKILPGMLWEDEITNGINNAEIVIVCLSTLSLTKASYFSQELRLILDNADAKPDGIIYIIPLRLDNCEIPLWYRKWNNLDYFDGGKQQQNYHRLLQSLKIRAKQVISERFKERNLNLNFLDLSHNLLTELPAEIGQFTNLTKLNLESNQLNRLPPKLDRFINISSRFLPPNFNRLTILNLKNNGFDTFSKKDTHWLAHLNELDLENNQIVNLSPEITGLLRLKRLNLKNNAIVDLPPEIGQLSNLLLLDLSNNKLVNLPAEFGRLNSLTTLDISHNQFTNPPLALKNLTKLKKLDVRDNPLSIPPEILEKIYEPQVINNYFVEIWIGQRRPLAETKMLVVGQGSVGKTSLIRRLTENSFRSYETKTDGIAIDRWKVSNSEKGENQPEFLRVNIWDFGGQEIMHATHQFFLTRRSLYMLVLDARISQEENRVEYWLKIIQSFGGESPVLIVGNKTDQHPLDIDRTGLQKKYPNIVGILETSAVDGTGLTELKSTIAAQVNKLPHIRDSLPEVWFNVKNQLELLGNVQNYISQEKYTDTCIEGEIRDETSQRTLIGFLHDLGVVLHFQDDPRLESLGILNPQWVTNGVYKILNANILFQNKGVLEHTMLAEILPEDDYPANKRLFIVDMMRKFELCYDLAPDNTFLVPDLLPKDEPFTGEWDGTLAFQYDYNVFLSSIITRFIVRMNGFIHKTVWRSGVVLKKDDNIALVKADIEDNKVYIWVNGPEHTRRDFLAAIRAEFDAIHKTIIKIEATQKIPVPGHPEDEPIPFEMLLQAEREGRATIPVMANGRLIDVNVRELLNGIAPETDRLRGGHVTQIQIGNDFTGNLTVGDENIAKSTVSPLKASAPPAAPVQPVQAAAESRSLPLKILAAIFVTLPRVIGRAVLDIFGRGKDSADSTAIVLGYMLIVLAALVLWGILDLNSLRDWFTGWWRFFFPVK